jgi:hypothetical protein
MSKEEKMEKLLFTMALRPTMAWAGAAAAVSHYFPKNVVQRTYVDAPFLRHTTGRNFYEHTLQIS